MAWCRVVRLDYGPLLPAAPRVRRLRSSARLKPSVAPRILAARLVSGHSGASRSGELYGSYALYGESFEPLSLTAIPALSHVTSRGSCRHMVGLLLLLAKGRAEWQRKWRHCIVGWDGHLYAARACAENRYLCSPTHEACCPALPNSKSMLSKRLCKG